jgi:hypothetical protein
MRIFERAGNPAEKPKLFSYNQNLNSRAEMPSAGIGLKPTPDRNI